MRSSSRIPGIDALRFLAFFKVYLLHVPVNTSNWWLLNLKTGGGIGVMFFFVLSGFLISRLLILEKQELGQIRTWRFIKRRSLRIWPLYFFVLIVVLALPKNWQELLGWRITGGYEPDWRFSFSFLENYNMLKQDAFPVLSPLPVFWSLCIEEQFYLLWLLLFSWVPLKHLQKMLLAFIPLAWLFRWLEPHIWHNTLMHTNEVTTNLDLFALGGLLALYYQSQSVKKIKIEAFLRRFSYPLLLLVIGVIYFHRYLLPDLAFSTIHLIRSTAFGLLFVLLIMLFITPDPRIKFKPNSLISKLGDYTYGLYMLHLLAIHSQMALFNYLGYNLNSFNTGLAFMAINMPLSFALAWLSRKWIEEPALMLKGG